MDANDPRQIDVRRQVEAAVTMATASAGARIAEGKEPFRIGVCLGAGRCLIPQGDGLPVACPFCTVVELAPDTERSIELLARRVISGH